MVIGGQDYVKQSLEMKEFPHIVIATPGWLAEHLWSPDTELENSFSNIKYLVIDEADRVVNDQSFKEELNTILSFIPKERNTFLFSATLTKDVIDRKDLFEDSKHEIKIVDTNTTL